MEEKQITQQDLDKLADILWWIKGYRAAAKGTTYIDCPFDGDHVEALEKSIKRGIYLSV